MIKVVMLCGGNDLYLKVKDHATRTADEDMNYACAGVSMMVQAFAETLNRAQMDGDLSALELELKSGRCIIHASAAPEYMEKLKAQCDMLSAGLDLIKERYPSQIQWGENKRLNC